MTKAIRSNNNTLLDKKIELFCQSSAELLASIHARCGNMNPKKPKQKRKRRQRKSGFER